MKEDELEKDKINCHCGGNTEKITIRWRGEEILHPLDVQKALEFSKAIKRG